MSNLIDHANAEFDRIGFRKPTRAEMRSRDIPQEDGGWEMAVRRDAMNIIEMFAKQGHSGTSAGQVISMVHQLLQFKPLSPLTNDPAEWHKIAEEMAGQKDLWQNRRQGEAFSHDGGKTFYLLNEYTKLAKFIKKYRLTWLRKKLKTSQVHPLHTSAEMVIDDVE